jgi:hypothetical protein
MSMGAAREVSGFFTPGPFSKVGDPRMSKTVTRRCDRCGLVIDSGGSIVRITAGTLLDNFGEELDLCDQCGRELLDFLQGARQRALDGPGEAQGARPDRKPARAAPRA